MAPCMEKLSELNFIESLFFNWAENIQQNMETIGQMSYYFLWPSPWILRRTMQGNIALTIFHSWWPICYTWKSVGTLFQCIIVPQLRGEGPKQEHNFMDPGYQSVTQWEKKPIHYHCKNRWHAKWWNLSKLQWPGI